MRDFKASPHRRRKNRSEAKSKNGECNHGPQQSSPFRSLNSRDFEYPENFVMTTVPSVDFNTSLVVLNDASTIPLGNFRTDSTEPKR